jgi:hypothetical protein
VEAIMDGGGGSPKDLGHLLPEVAAIIGSSIEDRIWFARQDKWVPYARSVSVLEGMRDVIGQPRQGRRKSMLLAGRPNNGKSALLQRFLDENPITTREDGQAVVSIVSISLPRKIDEALLWGEILVALGIPHRDTDSLPSKKNLAVRMLGQLHCRGILIDEIHHILLGHAREQRVMLAAIKGLSSEVGLALIVAGIKDAVRALKTDSQTWTRFETTGLPLWKLDREFLRLLTSLEAMLPLAEPSGLATKELAIKLHSLSGGTIGGVVDALKAAPALALRSGRERIDGGILSSLKPSNGDDFDVNALDL